MEAKDMLLDDALETAIRSERIIIKMKRTIIAQIIVIIMLIVVLIGG